MDGSHKKNTTGLCLLDGSTALQFLKSYRDGELTAAAPPSKVGGIAGEGSVRS